MLSKRYIYSSNLSNIIHYSVVLSDYTTVDYIAMLSGFSALTRMLLYMLPLLPLSTLILMMQESATCLLYRGSAVIETERLWPGLDGANEVGGGERMRSAWELVEELEEPVGEEEETLSATFWQELDSD